MKFIKNSPLWFSLSGALILLSVVLMGITYVQTGGFLKYGIDFTGGTLMEVRVEDEQKQEVDVKAVMNSFSEFTPTVQTANDNTYILKMKSLSNEEHDSVLASLQGSLGTIQETRFVTIGPSVGEVMKQRAFLALAVAIIAIVLYIAFAFREVPNELSSWKFGLSAIFALVHDVIITVGAFALLGLTMDIEVDILFITALLTVLGFSVHDTIVVFDRIRENSKFARPTETFSDIAEKSVKQTLTRSINTSLTVLFPLIALFIFGAESIRWFTFALIVGITIGTYSSIFLATPILVKWQGAHLTNLRKSED